MIGLSMGTAGLTFQSQLGQNIPQVVDSFRPLAPSAIGARPVRRFVLPPSIVPPALADPVVYVAQEREVQAVEVLGGVRIWTAPLASPPTRALRIDGDDLIVPTAHFDIHFDRNTGLAKPAVPNAGDESVAVLDAGARKIEVRRSGVVGFDKAPDLGSRTVTAACVMPKLMDDAGKERDVVFLAVGGVPEAIEAPSGKTLWVGAATVASDAVYDGGFVLVGVRGRELR